MAIISLLTDFGLRDGYVGVMKGVIWKINPEAQIADITHFIAPQDVRQGALALLRTTRYFPPGTVHVAVVDPGVGTARAAMAAQAGGHFFVGPDNGLFWPILAAAEKRGEKPRCFALDRPEYWLPEISCVFHGRDIFAPAAAHLSLGVPLEKMGSPLANPIQLSFPEPVKTAKGWRGEVIEVDNFGNLTCNFPSELATDPKKVKLQIQNFIIEHLHNTYGEVESGKLIALINDNNQIEIAVSGGNASLTLDAGIGTPVALISLE